MAARRIASPSAYAAISPLEYRWAALGLRKQSRQTPDDAALDLRMGQQLLLDDFDPAELPELPGLYLIEAPGRSLYVHETDNQIAENKTLQRLKRYALAANVLVEPHPRTGEAWSRIRWHWLRHYHRTRACVSKIRREVSKVAMGHAADAIHDHYRGLDRYAFHEEYAKFDSGIDDRLLERK